MLGWSTAKKALPVPVSPFIFNGGILLSEVTRILVVNNVWRQLGKILAPYQ